MGFLGYGASLVLFVLALRGFGSARAGAYISTAPFIGAAIAIVAFHEPTSVAFLIAVPKGVLHRLMRMFLLVPRSWRAVRGRI